MLRLTPSTHVTSTSIQSVIGPGDYTLDLLTEEQAQEFLLLATGRDSSGNRLTSTDIEDRAFKVIRGEFHTDGFNENIPAEAAHSR